MTEYFGSDRYSAVTWSCRVLLFNVRKGEEAQEPSNNIAAATIHQLQTWRIRVFRSTWPIFVIL